MSLSRNIKHYRIKKGLTQVQLGKESRLKEYQIARIERGLVWGRVCKHLVLISRALGITVDDLLLPESTRKTKARIRRN